MTDPQPEPTENAVPPPAVLDVCRVALMEIDEIVGNEMSLGSEECARIRGILFASLSERWTRDSS